ncbi:MAG: hypothetical protein QOG31_1310 [Thermoplasmata archaeon]|jgi:hypothetical protein|nr:hypothetical protein [Thermoplasmata archaeon]
MTRHRVFIILLFLPLAGCVGSPGASTPTAPPIDWGLSLAVPPTMPAPGAFWEGNASVAALSNALNQTAP